jgi:membrane associated rhomboid family serine protease
MDSTPTDKKRLLLSFIFPLCFVLFLWSIKIIETTTGLDLTHFGLYPLKKEGLIGIITGPLVHGDWKHLFNNSIPLAVLSWAIFYFYREIAFKVVLLIYITSEFWLWFFARPAWHIGASGLVYGFGAFVFTSGIIRKNKNLMAISLMVVFLYGSMVWGILPIDEAKSWEGHLMGMISGIIFAFYYKNFGPQNPEKEIEDDDEDEESEFPYWMVGHDDPDV